MAMLRTWTWMAPTVWAQFGAAPAPLPALISPAAIFANFTGTPGDDNFVGTRRADTFDLGQGGNDTASGGKGDDLFLLGGAFNSLDKLNGGGGFDTLQLDGDYSAGVTFARQTIKSIESIALAAGNSYSLTFSAKTVGAGATLAIDANGLAAGTTLTLDAAKVIGNLVITGGAGGDAVTLGGGIDTAAAGDGDDLIKAGAFLTAADAIDGGAGSDSLRLDGDYSAALTFGATTLVDVEFLTLVAGYTYKLTTHDATVAAGAMLTVRAATIDNPNRLVFDGSAETDGRFTIVGSSGADRLTGGSGDDTFDMGHRVTDTDFIDGGAGYDTIELDGDYPSLDVSATTINGVERFVLRGGLNEHVNFIMHSGAVAAGETLTIDATRIGGGNNGGVSMGGVTYQAGSIFVLGSDSGDIWEFAGDGDHTFNGGDGNDGVYGGGAGTNLLYGGAGSDSIGFGGDNAFGPDDRVEGGTGDLDQFNIGGSYSSPLTITATMLNGFNYFRPLFDNAVDVTFEAGTFDAGIVVGVDGQYVIDGSSFDFSAVAASFEGTFYGADATWLFGSGNDAPRFHEGGLTLDGGDGNDILTVQPDDFATDFIDGGAGTDMLGIFGFGPAVNLDSTRVSGIEGVKKYEDPFNPGGDYVVTLDASAIAGLATFTVDTSDMAHGSFQFIAPVNLTGTDFYLYGGAGDDDFLGAAGDDTLTGGGGQDFLWGTGGTDTFVYNAVSDSTGPNFDTWRGFAVADDFADVPFSVTGIDATITTGHLNFPSFNLDLEIEVSASRLAVHHAVLFTPNSGLVGYTFLIADANGEAGYQTNEDLVIRLINTNTVTEDMFI
jgi:hypothetical protein